MEPLESFHAAGASVDALPDKPMCPGTRPVTNFPLALRMITGHVAVTPCDQLGSHSPWTQYLEFHLQGYHRRSPAQKRICSLPERSNGQAVPCRLATCRDWIMHAALGDPSWTSQDSVGHTACACLTHFSSSTSGYVRELIRSAVLLLTTHTIRLDKYTCFWGGRYIGNWFYWRLILWSFWE
jgi:hypothetical protein